MVVPAKLVSRRKFKKISKSPCAIEGPSTPPLAASESQYLAEQPYILISQNAKWQVVCGLAPRMRGWEPRALMRQLEV
ncbi:hypothetical protein SKAU_G00382150 [Synaphobranchus kaupii]|uniref:Uncharacterized protein n=1 Tax=Synaphobranchus kaupii TaxID=118154 RepID=A0A9Q1EDU3_SYNKA|nr:hypothetical protein SKAU_G00382150 [Synaphobranchus kaupii]